MFVHESVAVSDPRAAMRALVSREGAAAFRDIKAYSTYEKKGRFVEVAYQTTFGTVSMTLDPREYEVSFVGKAPLGVSFEGCWKHVGTRVILEQRVFGVPGLLRPLVRGRVARALEDLAAL